MSPAGVFSKSAESSEGGSLVSGVVGSDMLVVEFGCSRSTGRSYLSLSSGRERVLEMLMYLTMWTDGNAK